MDTRITQLADYVAIVKHLSRLWAEKGADWFVHPWFRGHADESWKLQPGVYRYQKVQGVGAEYYNELKLLDTFKLRAPRFIERMPANDWEWWGLMQHHGLPTRLLDWTESSLIALHFAVRDNDLKRDAAVWAMNPWWLNKQRFGEYVLFATDQKQAAGWHVGSLTEERPIALLPAHGNSRIHAQRGSFTVHGHDPEGLDRLAVTEVSKDVHLCKFTIPRSAIVELRDELALAGIADSLIYPELDGLCRELKRRFFHV